MTYTQLLFLFGVLLPLTRFIWKRATRPAPFPPGPPADPIIGHARAFPRKDAHLGLADLAQKYGDVMYFNILGKSLVVLSSQRAASYLLDKKSAIYSSRPRLPLHELVGWADMLAFLPYGDDFSKQRKFFQQVLTRQGCLGFRPIQSNQTHALLKNFLHEPNQYADHVRRFAAGVILEISHGHRITSNDDPYIRIADEINQLMTDLGDTSILDFIPALKYLPAWFPGSAPIQKAKSVTPLIHKFRNLPYDEVRSQMAAGTAPQSFLSMQIEELEREGKATEEDLQCLKVAASHMYGAGAETTWTMIMNFIAIMLLHPDVQEKAQVEIDTIIGSGRLPDFSDRPSLPYVECVMYEIMRWRPVAPLGIPHSTTADDVYRGMYIPKGSTVLTNAVAITSDEEFYKNPSSFCPERFLPEHNEPVPINAAFGYGRRICPGRHLADAGVWMVIASILAAFEIKPAKDKNGSDIPLDIRWTTALTSHPEPFECLIRPRSEKVVHVIEQL